MAEAAMPQAPEVQVRVPDNQLTARSPLDIPAVLCQVFDKCSVDTLKTARLVCKNWWILSLETWREKSVLRIYGEQREPRRNTLSNYPGILLAEFNRRWLMQDNNDQGNEGVDSYMLKTVPFKQFELVNWTLPTDRGNVPQQTFWTQVRNTVEHFTIYNSVVKYEDDLWTFFNSFPNFSSLYMFDNLTNGRNAGGSPWRGYIGAPDQQRDIIAQLNDIIQCPRLKVLRIRSQEALAYINRILKRFPNLEELAVSSVVQQRPYGRPSIWFIPIRNMFRTLKLEQDRGPERFRQLRRLDIMDALDDAIRDFIIIVDYEDFAKFKLPLTHLDIDFGEKTTQSALKIAVGTHAETLEVLRCFRAPTYPPYPHSFPWGIQLNNLRELYLWGFIVHNVGLVRFMPNLKILQINFTCYDKWYKLEYLIKKRWFLPWSEDIVANTVDMLKHKEIPADPVAKTLERLYLDYDFPVSSWNYLRKWMPNLRSITTILNDQTLLQVAKLWPNVAELELLFGSDISDEGIIRAGYILRNLRVFKLETYCCQSQLTDQAIYEAFLPQRWLESVDIFVSQGVSQEGEKHLREKLGEKRVKIHRNTGKHDLKCCKRCTFNFRTIPPETAPEDPKVLRSGRLRNPNSI